MRRLPNRIATIFNRHGFARDVSVLMSGTAIAQGLTIAAAPVLSRLYDPASFGIFALFTSIVSILSVVATWRYELAIVIPREDDDAANILFLACFAALLTSTASAFIVVTGGGWIVASLGSPKLQTWLWWLPLSIAMIGFYQALNYWSTRRKHFNRLSISQVFRSIASTGTQTSAGIAGLGATGLIGGQVAGQAMATVVLGAQVWGNDRTVVRNALDYSKIKALARKYIDFPKYNSIKALVSSLSQNLPPFLLAFYFSSVAVGLYAISLRFLQLPLNLIGQSVKQVFFQRANEADRTGDSYELLRKTTLVLLAIGLVPTLVITLFGPSAMAFVLGAEWKVAGVYAQFMMPWLLIGFINTPSVMMIPILNLQNVHMVYEIVFLAFRAGAIAAGAYLGSDVASIAIYSVVGFIFNLALILYVMHHARKRNQRIGDSELYT